MRACLILVLAGLVCAQTPEKYPLEAFHVEGNQQISAERILNASGLKIGAPVNKADFDAARQLFYNGDYAGALTSTNKALASMPNDPIVHEFRALVMKA